jgi:hypothetical protein
MGDTTKKELLVPNTRQSLILEKQNADNIAKASVIEVAIATLCIQNMYQRS